MITPQQGHKATAEQVPLQPLQRRSAESSTSVSDVLCLRSILSCCGYEQMYEERRRAREAEREARELAEEEDAARKEQARLKAQDEEAARWMGQIDLQQQGEEAQTEEQTQVRPAISVHSFLY